MSNRTIIYSGTPLAIADLKLDAEEFQHVVYMPIKAVGSAMLRLPESLQWARPAVEAAVLHLTNHRCPDLFESWYVYLSVKRSWVGAGTAGNREGWHIDGYGSNGDKNFIWCDSTPAEYMKGTFNLPADHAGCLERLEYLGDKMGTHFISSGELLPGQLYDLGQSVHRCGIAKVSGMRTFLKVSVSRDKYDLKGNARNPLLPSTHWPLKDRQGTRNHPTAQPGNGRAEAYRCESVDLEALALRGIPKDPSLLATHGIHKGTQIAQTGTEQLHNEGSLS